MIGRTLGRYEIVRQLGAGGMGVVYAARDTELEREVAIKILPDEFAADEVRRTRFEREAKTIASLNHPNICTLYDVGREDGIRFLVMELIEGESLEERLKRERLSTDKALEYGGQIADALDRAHSSGIVHRDLKPANVMVTKGGVKLLDFGLAQVRRNSVEELREMSTEQQSLTAEGTLLGTLPYMAPEQLHGEEADARTDIFALGAVLYEMLTGLRAFAGSSRASLISAIVSGEPQPIRELQPLTPPTLEHVIGKCLEKEPDDRWQSAHDIATELRWIAEGGIGDAASRDSPPSRPNRAVLGVIIALVATGAVVAGSWIGRGLATPDGRATTNLGSGSPKLVRLTWEPGTELRPSISPDGSSFVYVKRVSEPGTEDIFFRRIGGETAINLTKDCTKRDIEPSFSPDGQSIVHRSDCDGGGIFIMGATGESRRRLTDFGRWPQWSPDGRSVAFHVQSGKDSGLWITDVATGTARKLLGSSASNVAPGRFLMPSWSPSGTRIAFHRIDEETGTWSLATVAVEGGAPSDVMTLNSRMVAMPVWTREGIFFADGALGQTNLSRVRVSESTGEKLSDIEPVTVSMTWARFPSATMDGRRVVFASGNPTMEFGVSSFDPDGEPKLSNWRSIRVDPRDVKGLCPSPDGEWVATVNLESYPEYQDVLLIRTSTGETSQLTNDPELADPFAWTPDGSRILLNREINGRYEVWWIRRDGSGLERVATGHGEEPLYGMAISADGRWLYSIEGADERACVVDLGVPFEQRVPEALPLLPDGKLFDINDGLTESGEASHDGRWLVGYAREAAGRPSTALYLYDVHEKLYTKLIDTEERYWCSWLPDSRRILLWTGSSTEVRLIDRETRRITVIPDANPAATDTFRVLALSRDGQLMFTWDWREEDDIWMLDYGEAR